MSQKRAITSGSFARPAACKGSFSCNLRSPFRRDMGRWFAAMPLALLLPGCGGGGGGSADAAAEGDQEGVGARDTVAGRYVGEATTAVVVRDVFLQPFERQYRGKVQVTLSPPLQTTFRGTTFVESNPFNLLLGALPPVPLPAAPEGQLAIASASVFYEQADAVNGLLYRYWELTRNGTEIAGTLTETHLVSGLVLNGIKLPQDLTGGLVTTTQYPMAVGTRFTGTLTDTEIRLKLEGNTVDGFRPFVSEVVATRVE